MIFAWIQKIKKCTIYVSPQNLPFELFFFFLDSSGPSSEMLSSWSILGDYLQASLWFWSVSLHSLELRSALQERKVTWTWPIHSRLNYQKEKPLDKNDIRTIMYFVCVQDFSSNFTDPQTRLGSTDCSFKALIIEFCHSHSISIYVIICCLFSPLLWSIEQAVQNMWSIKNIK